MDEEAQPQQSKISLTEEIFVEILIFVFGLLDIPLPFIGPLFDFAFTQIYLNLRGMSGTAQLVMFGANAGSEADSAIPIADLADPFIDVITFFFLVRLHNNPSKATAAIEKIGGAVQAAEGKGELEEGAVGGASTARVTPTEGGVPGGGVGVPPTTEVSVPRGRAGETPSAEGLAGPEAEGTPPSGEEAPTGGIGAEEAGETEEGVRERAEAEAEKKFEEIEEAALPAAAMEEEFPSSAEGIQALAEKAREARAAQEEDTVPHIGARQARPGQARTVKDIEKAPPPPPPPPPPLEE